jgi:hypothetical protein
MIYLLTISLILLTVISILAVIKSDLKGWATAVIIPFLLFNVGFSWHTIESIKGEPALVELHGEMEFLFAVINRPTIYVLVREPGKENPRYYAIPYSEKTANDMTKAMRSTKNGERMMVKASKGDGTAGERNPQQRFEFYRFQHEELMPKHTEEK